MPVEYWLGVDLGTTNTAAAVRVDGRVEVVQLGDQHTQIPSVVFIQPDGNPVVGEAAERRGRADPQRLVREFKRRVGDDVPLLRGGISYTAPLAMGRLLEHVVTAVTAQRGDPPTGITVTCPANWGPYKHDLLDKAFRQVDLPDVRRLTEPEAAAIHYASGHQVQPGEIVAVYDLGGGTFDSAVLRKSQTGFAVLGQPDGLDELGGANFDDAVFQHIQNTIGVSPDPQDTAASTEWIQLRRGCVEAKEILSFETDTVINVTLPGLHTSVRLTRPEFEEMIAGYVTETVECLRRTLRSAHIEPGQLRTILLTGGSARIPMISERIGREFHAPITLDPRPERSIALGAALARLEDTKPMEPQKADDDDVVPPNPAPPLPPTPPIDPPDENHQPAPTTENDESGDTSPPPAPPLPHDRPAPEHHWRRGLLAAATVAAVLLIGAVTFLVWPRPSPPDPGQGPDTTLSTSTPSTATSTTTTTPTPAPVVPATVETVPHINCIPVTIAVSSEKSALLTQLAAGYAAANRGVNGKCFDMMVESVASGTAEAALASGWDPAVNGAVPDVWTPAASTWVTLLRSDLQRNGHAELAPAQTPSITSTPLVLAMPQPMAEALGWPATPIGWSDVLNLANDPQGWASKGHPEWGRFALGKTNPTVSTSGLAATIGTLGAAANGTSVADLNLDDLQNPTVRQFLSDVERSVIHYGDTTLTYLTNLQHDDDAGTALNYLSAVAVEEKSVLDYDAGNPSGDVATPSQHAPPKVPLVAVYPKEGTLYSDNPYVVLNSSSPDKQAGAADFLNYLLLPDQQKIFTDANFRTANHQPGAPITASNDVIADSGVPVLNPPGQQVLTGVRDLWNQVRKPARVLLLLDISKSMEDPSEVGGPSKLDLAKTAATTALAQLSDTDQVGLWTFTTHLPTPDTITDRIVPIAPLSQDRGQLTDAIKALTPVSGTPLYAATRAAAEEMNTTTDPNAINAVVLLTDGQNDTDDPQDLASLVQQLSGGTGQGGVRIFSIAYGADADLPVLQQISQASRAGAYDARTPAAINKVFNDVLSNF